MSDPVNGPYPAPPAAAYPPPPPYLPPAPPAPSPQYPVASQYPGAPQFAAPYAAAPTGSFPIATPPTSRRLFGVVAVVLGALSIIGAPLVAGVAGYRIGLGVGAQVTAETFESTDIDLSFFTPVRDWVLLGEIGFWTGTVLGLTAIALGIVAVVRRGGRALGITAIATAVVAPGVFFVALWMSLAIGAGVGSASG